MPLEKDQAMTAGNMHKKFDEVWPHTFELSMRTDRQKNRHTHHNTLQPYRGEVYINT